MHPVGPPAGDHGPKRLQKRLGHRRDDQENHQRPDRQEQPLLDAQPPPVLADGRQQKPHRRPGDFPVLAAIQEVDHYRNPGRRQRVQERGVGEIPGPRPAAASRTVLYWCGRRHARD